jgi:hypothetical protein
MRLLASAWRPKQVDRILLSDVLPEEEWAVAREAVEAARLDLAVLWADAGPAP